MLLWIGIWTLPLCNLYPVDSWLCAGTFLWTWADVMCVISATNRSPPETNRSPPETNRSPPETNRSPPENRPTFPKWKDHLPTINFQGQTVSFREGMFSLTFIAILILEAFISDWSINLMHQYLTGFFDTSTSHSLKLPGKLTPYRQEATKTPLCSRPPQKAVAGWKIHPWMKIWKKTYWKMEKCNQLMLKISGGSFNFQLQWYIMSKISPNLKSIVFVGERWEFCQKIPWNFPTNQKLDPKKSSHPRGHFAKQAPWNEPREGLQGVQGSKFWDPCTVDG